MYYIFIVIQFYRQSLAFLLTKIIHYQSKIIKPELFFPLLPIFLFILTVIRVLTTQCLPKLANASHKLAKWTGKKYSLLATSSKLMKLQQQHWRLSYLLLISFCEISFLAGKWNVFISKVKCYLIEQLISMDFSCLLTHCLLSHIYGLRCFILANILA